MEIKNSKQIPRRRGKTKPTQIYILLFGCVYTQISKQINKKKRQHLLIAVYGQRMHATPQKQLKRTSGVHAAVTTLRCICSSSGVHAATLPMGSTCMHACMHACILGCICNYACTHACMHY